MSRSHGNPRLTDRVNFHYKKVELTDVPLVWNMLYYPSKGGKNTEPISKTLEELGEPNIGEFLNDFLVNKVSQVKIDKLNKIYKVLLSIL